jgi:hypothetical protein
MKGWLKFDGFENSASYDSMWLELNQLKMGRRGDFFRKIGRGIKRGKVWVSDHWIRPMSNLISNSVAGMTLDSLGPVWRVVSMAGRAVHMEYNI